MKSYTTVMTIAGSDSCAGAGIQADMKTISALGGYAVTVLTALTAQNTVGVQAVMPVDGNFVKTQMDSILSDIEVSAIKIGMLHNQEVVEHVAGVLKANPNIPVVLDPVMLATSGDRLIDENCIEYIIGCLFPLVELITPNIQEAELLSRISIHDQQSAYAACQNLSGKQAKNILITGGDKDGDVVDDWFWAQNSGKIQCFQSPRIQTQNTHGTGCSLSSAIATFLGFGCDVSEAVKRAKAYISEAIMCGAEYQLGRGHGPIGHFLT